MTPGAAETSGALHEAEHAARLRAVLQRSPLIAPILAGLAGTGLPDCWLAAGAVAQTVWNDAFRLPPGHGIADIDIVYFDSADLSEDAENDAARRVAARFADIPLRLDVKNEARVHLWYEARFGYPIRPYRSMEDAIRTFPTTSTAIGVRPEAAGLRMFAPCGLSDLFGLTVRANPAQITRDIYEAKVSRWLTLWPGLRVMPWQDRPAPAAP